MKSALFLLYLLLGVNILWIIRKKLHKKIPITKPWMEPAGVVLEFISIPLTIILFVVVWVYK